MCDGGSNLLEGYRIKHASTVQWPGDLARPPGMTVPTHLGKPVPSRTRYPLALPLLASARRGADSRSRRPASLLILPRGPLRHLQQRLLRPREPPKHFPQRSIPDCSGSPPRHRPPASGIPPPATTTAPVPSSPPAPPGKTRVRWVQTRFFLWPSPADWSLRPRPPACYVFVRRRLAPLETGNSSSAFLGSSIFPSQWLFFYSSLVLKNMEKSKISILPSAAILTTESSSCTGLPAPSTPTACPLTPCQRFR